MAAFTHEQSLQHPLDYRLLQDAPVVIYHDPSVLQADLTALGAIGYRTLTIDLARCNSGNRFYDAIIQTLSLPSWWGRNRNALREAFEDINVPSPGGVVLVFDNAHRFPATELKELVEDLAAASRHHLLHGQRLILIVRTDHKLHQIEIPCLGASQSPTESWR